MCSERSGSNFITKLLNGHSQICGPSTKHIMNPLLRNLFRYEALEKEENWNEVLIDVLRLLNLEFSIWNKNFELSELKYNVDKGDVKGLLNYIFESEAKASGKTQLFIKEIKLYEFFPYLLVNYPNAKFVYQTRDPRDVALSWKKNLTHYGGIVNAAKQWKLDQQQSLKNYHLLKKSSRSYILKYEDIISDVEFHSNELLGFLGLKYEGEMINFHKDSLTQKNAGTQKAWKNLSRGVISNNSGKFENELSEIEIKIIEKICFFEMKQLGYKTKYSLEDLDQINDVDIEHFNETEINNLPYEIHGGVLNNMAAKKIFYQKII